MYSLQSASEIHIKVKTCILAVLSLKIPDKLIIMNMLKSFVKISPVLFLSVVIICNSGCRNKPSAQNDGWVDLFDGKTLTGWKILNEDYSYQGNQPEFYVQDGMIICNTKSDVGGGYLVTEKNYDDFILELDVKIDSSLNSGIQCRGQIWQKDTVAMYLAGDAKGTLSQQKFKAGYIWGYQIEVDPSDRAWSGGLYEPGNRGWLVRLTDNEAGRKAFKPLEWNHFKILMDGNKIQAWVNGVQTVDTTDDMNSTGFIGLQFHGAGKEQNNMKSFWKNIKIKEL